MWSVGVEKGGGVGIWGIDGILWVDLLFLEIFDKKVVLLCDNAVNLNIYDSLIGGFS